MIIWLNGAFGSGRTTLAAGRTLQAARARLHTAA